MIKFHSKKVRGGRIHCIAHCTKCDWIEEGMTAAIPAAHKHTRETGHEVAVEEGIWIRIVPTT